MYKIQVKSNLYTFEREYIECEISRLSGVPDFTCRQPNSGHRRQKIFPPFHLRGSNTPESRILICIFWQQNRDACVREKTSSPIIIYINLQTLSSPLGKEI